MRRCACVGVLVRARVRVGARSGCAGHTSLPTVNGVGSTSRTSSEPREAVLVVRSDAWGDERAAAPLPAELRLAERSDSDADDVDADVDDIAPPGATAPRCAGSVRTHTHTHTHAHTHTRTHVHTRTHTRTHTYTHAHTHARTHTHTDRERERGAHPRPGARATRAGSPSAARRGQIRAGVPAASAFEVHPKPKHPPHDSHTCI